MHIYLLYLAALVLLQSTLSHAAWAQDKLVTLSRAEKIGQLIAARIESGHDATYLDQLLTQYKVGSLIPLQYWTLTEHQNLVATVHSFHLALPPLMLEDAEWGVNMHVPALPAFPKAMTLAATANATLIYRVGHAIGTQCKALGIDINIAPVLDVNGDAANPVIGMRSFGDTKEAVTRCAQTYAQGLTDAGIMPCLKHFPGHGRTHTDPHITLPILTEPLAAGDRATLLCPFFDILRTLPCCVMVGHIAYPVLEADSATRPAITSSRLVTEILAPHMSINTIIISDALNMGALKEFGTPGDIALQALKAGIDILLCPPDIEAVINRIYEALESGEYSEAELDAHVLKILQVKESLGLHEQHTRAVPALELYEDLIQEAYDAAATACNGFVALMCNLNKYKMVTLGLSSNVLCPCYDPAASYKKPLCIYLYPGGYKTHRLSEVLIQNLKQIISSNPDSIVFLFGSPYCLIDIPHTVPTVLLYEDVVYAHATAEKILSGLVVPQGHLPVTISI